MAFVVSGLSLVVGCIGALTLTRATRRYTRVATGSLDFARQGRLVRSLTRDLMDSTRLVTDAG